MVTKSNDAGQAFKLTDPAAPWALLSRFELIEFVDQPAFWEALGMLGGLIGEDDDIVVAALVNTSTESEWFGDVSLAPANVHTVTDVRILAGVDLYREIAATAKARRWIASKIAEQLDADADDGCNDMADERIKRACIASHTSI